MVLTMVLGDIAMVSVVGTLLGMELESRMGMGTFMVMGSLLVMGVGSFVGMGTLLVMGMDRRRMGRLAPSLLQPASSRCCAAQHRSRLPTRYRLTQVRQLKLPSHIASWQQLPSVDTPEQQLSTHHASVEQQ